MTRKPTGQLGKLEVNFGDKSSISFEAIDFPDQKEDIEALFVERFFAQPLTHEYFPFEILDYEQNAERNLDFTLRTSQGNKLLELMEIAPLEHIQGSYDEASNSYNNAEFAISVHEKLMKKSDGYTSREESNISLLLYPTDYRFALSDTAVAWLQYLTITQAHYFECIFYFFLLDNKSGVTNIRFPTDSEYFADFDENKNRKSWSIFPRPEDWNFGRE